MKLRVILFILALFAGASAQADNPLVKMTTSYGEIVFELYPDKAPITVANFMNYANSGFYEGTIFHRVINNFMVQGGGYTPYLEHKPTQAPIPNEADNGLKNEMGTLAMAHNSDPDSATSQFYINLADNKYLNHRSPQPQYYGYCVFGKIVKGLEVVKRIAATPTRANGRFASDVPVKLILIQKVEPVSADEITPSARTLSQL